MLGFRKAKAPIMLLVGNQKVCLNLNLTLHGAFLASIKYFGYKIGIQFNNTPLVVEQNNYATKIVNAYIIYDLDNWPKVPLRNFTLINCLFGAINILKNSDKNKYVYSGYGVAFDGKYLMNNSSLSY